MARRCWSRRGAAIMDRDGERGALLPPAGSRSRAGSRPSCYPTACRPRTGRTGRSRRSRTPSAIRLIRARGTLPHRSRSCRRSGLFRRRPSPRPRLRPLGFQFLPRGRCDRRGLRPSGCGGLDLSGDHVKPPYDDNTPPLAHRRSSGRPEKRGMVGRDACSLRLPTDVPHTSQGQQAPPIRRTRSSWPTHAVVPSCPLNCTSWEAAATPSAWAVPERRPLPGHAGTRTGYTKTAC